MSQAETICSAARWAAAIQFGCVGSIDCVTPVLRPGRRLCGEVSRASANPMSKRRMSSFYDGPMTTGW